MIKCLAQGHKCHGRDSNPHSAANKKISWKNSTQIVLDKLESKFESLFLLLSTFIGFINAS